MVWRMWRGEPRWSRRVDTVWYVCTLAMLPLLARMQRTQGMFVGSEDAQNIIILVYTVRRIGS